MSYCSTVGLCQEGNSKETEQQNSKVPLKCRLCKILFYVFVGIMSDKVKNWQRHLVVALRHHTTVLTRRMYLSDSVYVVRHVKRVICSCRNSHKCRLLSKVYLIHSRKLTENACYTFRTNFRTLVHNVFSFRFINFRQLIWYSQIVSISGFRKTPYFNGKTPYCNG